MVEGWCETSGALSARVSQWGGRAAGAVAVVVVVLLLCWAARQLVGTGLCCFGCKPACDQAGGVCGTRATERCAMSFASSC